MSLTDRIAKGKIVTLIAKRPQPFTARWYQQRDAKQAEWVRRAHEGRLPIHEFKLGAFVPRGSERGA